MGKKTATSINSFLKWWAFVIFFFLPLSPPLKPSGSKKKKKEEGQLPQPPVDTFYLRFPHSTHRDPSLRGFALCGRPPSSPTLARSWTSAVAPDGYGALHFCNHRQLVPSDYTPLNAVLSAVAHSNTERD